MMTSRHWTRQWVKRLPWLVWALGIVPLVLFGVSIASNSLGADPLETLIRGSGLWALKFLTATLLVTPVCRLAGWAWLAPARRHLGLLTFSYALVHLSLYLGLDQELDAAAIFHDVVKRPFITLGMTAFFLMLPLALTSTNGMIRRLGGRVWKRLHRAVYAIAVLAVVHYFVLVKRDVTQPAIYAVVIGVLLGIRAVWAWRKAAKNRVQQPMAPTTNKLPQVS